MLATLLITLLAGTSSPDDPTTAADAKPKAELRSAEASPVEKVTENEGVDLSCKAGKAYLHRMPTVEREDIAAARVQGPEGQSDGDLVLVEPTPEAEERLPGDSADNPDSPLVLLVDGKVAAAVVIKSRFPAGPVPFGPFVGARRIGSRHGSARSDLVTTGRYGRRTRR